MIDEKHNSLLYRSRFSSSTMPRGRDEESLITVVQSHQELWDPGHDKYKDALRKENIWAAIADRLEITGKIFV